MDGRFLKKEHFALENMSSEVKLIVQNHVIVNENDGSFNLNFAGGYLEGKKKLCLKMTIST